MIRITTMRNKEWTCCFGLHVRTATIMIGVWHLFLNVLALGFLAVIVRNPAMLTELQNDGFDDEYDTNSPLLPTPVSIERPPQYAYRDHSLQYHNIDMGGLVCLCMIAIALMLIYGAVKGKPSHLLPFFCLQLFDFAITTLTAAGYLCYLRSVHGLIAESHRLPWREELLQLNPQTLSVIVLFSFISVVFLKAYSIGIIWRCYKYLTMRQHNLRSTLPYIIPDVSAVRQERDYSSLLPDYEEAILKQAPPPSYAIAVANGYRATVVLPPVLETPTTSSTLSPRNGVDLVAPPPYMALEQSPQHRQNLNTTSVDEQETRTTSMQQAAAPNQMSTVIVTHTNASQ